MQMYFENVPGKTKGSKIHLIRIQKWLLQLHGKKEWQENVWYLHKVVEILLVEVEPSRTRVATITTNIFRKSKVLLIHLNRIQMNQGSNPGSYLAFREHGACA